MPMFRAFELGEQFNAESFHNCLTRKQDCLNWIFEAQNQIPSNKIQTYLNKMDCQALSPLPQN